LGTQLVLLFIIIHILQSRSCLFIFYLYILLFWPTWSEKILAKARRYGFKDVLLGKVNVPRTNEDYDMESEEGKKLTIAADMNELTYTELILSIDDKTSNGKVAFNLVRGCKNKDYANGNASMAW
jgi:hypothetical protein